LRGPDQYRTGLWLISMPYHREADSLRARPEEAERGAFGHAAS